MNNSSRINDPGRDLINFSIGINNNIMEQLWGIPIPKIYTVVNRVDGKTARAILSVGN